MEWSFGRRRYTCTQVVTGAERENGKIGMDSRKERVNHLPEYLPGRATGGGVTGWKVFVGIVGWHKGMELLEEMFWRVHREGETWIHYKVQQSLWRREVGWEERRCGRAGDVTTALISFCPAFSFSLFIFIRMITSNHAAESISDCLKIFPEKKINPVLFNFALVRF